MKTQLTQLLIRNKFKKSNDWIIYQTKDLEYEVFINEKRDYCIVHVDNFAVDFEGTIEETIDYFESKFGEFDENDKCLPPDESKGC